MIGIKPLGYKRLLLTLHNSGSESSGLGEFDFQRVGALICDLMPSVNNNGSSSPKTFFFYISLKTIENKGMHYIKGHFCLFSYDVLNCLEKLQYLAV